MQTKNFSIKQAFNFTLSALSSWGNLSKFLLWQIINLLLAGIGYISLMAFTIGFSLKDLSIHHFLGTGIDGSLVIAAQQHVIVFGIYTILAFIVMLFAPLCPLKMSLDIYDNKRPGILKSLLAIKNIFFKYLGLIFISLFAVALGVGAITIPVLYLADAFGDIRIIAIIGACLFLVYSSVLLSLSLFSHILILDTGSGPINSIRKSMQLTKGVRIKLVLVFWLMIISAFVFEMLLGLIFTNFISVALCSAVIKSIVATISSLMIVSIYRQLQKYDFCK